MNCLNGFYIALCMAYFNGHFASDWAQLSYCPTIQGYSYSYFFFYPNSPFFTLSFLFPKPLENHHASLTTAWFSYLDFDQFPPDYLYFLYPGSWRCSHWPRCQQLYLWAFSLKIVSKNFPTRGLLRQVWELHSCCQMSQILDISNFIPLSWIPSCI